MVSFAFESASAVAVGTFNIHIFTPDWLVGCGALKQENFELQFALTRPGFRIPLKQEPATWSIQPDRVEITSTCPDFDCGAALAQVLLKLPETPMFAVGTNVTYTCPNSNLSPIDALSNIPTEIDGVKNDSRVIAMRFVTPPNYNRVISLDQSEATTKAIGNSEKQGQVASELVDAAKDFSANVAALEKLLAEVWNISIRKEVQS